MTTVQQAEPTQSLEFVCEWFERAHKNAAAAGKKDAAVLWGDGLDQIRSMATQRDELVAALQNLADAADNLGHAEGGQDGRFGLERFAALANDLLRKVEAA